MRRVLSAVTAAARVSAQQSRLPTTRLVTTVGESEAARGAEGEEGSTEQGLLDDDGGSVEGLSHHCPTVDGTVLGCSDPLLLPAALKVPEHLSTLMSAGEGEDLVGGVHRLSARSRGIIELPERLDRAVKVAVRDTGHTHRQIKAKGRSLLDALKSISRGMPTPDADESAVKEWLMKGGGGGSKKNPTGLNEADMVALSMGDALDEGMEWGVRLPVRKQKRILEGIREDAAMATSGPGPAGRGGRGGKAGRGDKKKKKPVMNEASTTSYGPLEAAAYAVTRLPMTFGAQQRVLRELKVRSPGFEPRTLLDFGAGPAPSLWATRRVFGDHFGTINDDNDDDAASAPGAWGRNKWGGSLRATTTLVDASPSMMAFTRRIAKVVYDDHDLEDLGEEMGFLSKPTGRPLPDPDPWGNTGPVRTAASLRSLNPKASFDLVVAAYSLGEVKTEVGQKRLDDTVLALWSRVSSRGALVLIEPGTPRGSELIRRARTLVLEAERTAAEKKKRAREEQGEQEHDNDNPAATATFSVSIDAHVVAPCQHDRVCPMDGLNSWCHFSQRVKRTEMHRQMLPRGRGPQHQDERFSYVVIRRLSREEAAAELAERAARIAAGDFGQFDREDDDDFEEDDEENMDEEEREERRLIRMSIRGSGIDDSTAREGREEMNEEENRMGMSMRGEGDHQDVKQVEDDEEHDDEEGEEEEETLAEAVAVASSHAWGRMVRPPIKKSGHVIIDLCAAEGNLSRHIVARSSAWEGGVGKSGYKAARKSKWGDLWPYKDPRRVNELDEDDASLHEFFKDFEGVDMDEVKGVVSEKDERKTPVGIGSARKPFMSKRPKVVEQFVEMEKSGEFNMHDDKDYDEK